MLDLVLATNLCRHPPSEIWPDALLAGGSRMDEVQVLPRLRSRRC